MIIIANWKAYVGDIAKAKALVASAKRKAAKSSHTVIIAPPTPFIGVFAEKKTAPILLCAQDVSLQTAGAHTGESTAQAFASVRATHTLVGHSERRAEGDTNEIVATKIAHALAQNLIPVLCIGERERDADAQYLSFVREELQSALAPLSPKERSRIIFAYEPIWAIGKTAEDAIHPHDLTEMVLYIRKILAEFLPGKKSATAPVLYGGSVEPGNIRALAGASLIDGVLVGHASADATLFARIIDELS